MVAVTCGTLKMPDKTIKHCYPKELPTQNLQLIHVVPNICLCASVRNLTTSRSPRGLIKSSAHKEIWGCWRFTQSQQDTLLLVLHHLYSLSFLSPQDPCPDILPLLLLLLIPSDCRAQYFQTSVIVWLTLLHTHTQTKKTRARVWQCSATIYQV